MNRILLLLFLLLLPGLSALAETRFFELRHRRAADLAVQLQDALGREVRVVPVRDSLMVTGPAAELALADELIARLDRPARMLRIFVAQDQSDSLEGYAAGGAVAGRSGDAAISIGAPPPVPPRGGGTVIVGGEDGVVAASIAGGSRTEFRRAEQFVVSLEGSAARISVGQQLPFTERWLVLARRHARIVDNTRYETVDTGFEVTSMLLPDNRVELTIHPFMAFLAARGRQEIRFSELETQVVVPIGSWFDLGGTMGGRDEVSREILGTARSGASTSGGVRVRVELQPN